MAIFSEPIKLTPAPGVKTDGVQQVGRYGVKRFILNSTKEGQEWSKFVPDWRKLEKTLEVYAEHGIEQRGDQQLFYVDIGVREKLDQPVETSDGLEKLSLAALRTKAPQVGVVDSALMDKPQLIEAIRKGKKPEPVTA